MGGGLRAAAFLLSDMASNHSHTAPFPARLPLQPVPVPDPSGTPVDAEAYRRALGIENAAEAVEVERVYRIQLDAEPDRTDLLHNLGLLVHARGQSAEALGLIERAIQLAPDSQVYANSLGAVLHDLGRFPEAERWYRIALAGDDASSDAAFNLAALLLGQGRAEESTAALGDSRADEPLPRRLLRAQALRGARRVPEAWNLVRALLDAHREHFELWYLAGQILADLAHLQQACEVYEHAVRLRPTHFEASRALANAYAAAGHHDAALERLNWMIEQQPQSEALHQEFNSIAWLAGRDDLFLHSFEFARAKLGEHTGLLRCEAAIRLRLDQHVRAERLLRRALTLDSGDAAAAGLLARTLSGAGQPAESLPYFLQAVEGEPDHLSHRYELGFALLRLGRPDDAKTVFAEVLARNPHDQLALAGIALAWRELGDARYRSVMHLQSLVRVYDLSPGGEGESTEAFNARLTEELSGFHDTRRPPLDQTLRGGTQTIGRLFDRSAPALDRLKPALAGAVEDYLGLLPSGPHPLSRDAAGGFRFAGSWSCQLGPGGFHSNHVHPKGWISSVYYAALPGTLTDDDVHAGWLKFGESPHRVSARDVPELLVKPEIGRLVLFPSYFWHGTVPFPAGERRVTVAFDVEPTPIIATGP